MQATSSASHILRHTCIHTQAPTS